MIWGYPHFRKPHETSIYEGRKSVEVAAKGGMSPT